MYGHKETKKIVFLSTHLYSNVLFQSVFVIYMNSNTSIMFIKKKDFLKKITTSHVQKDIYIYIYSHHPFVFKYLIFICICYLFEFKYLNYVY